MRTDIALGAEGEGKHSVASPTLSTDACGHTRLRRNRHWHRRATPIEPGAGIIADACRWPWFAHPPHATYLVGNTYNHQLFEQGRNDAKAMAAFACLQARSTERIRQPPVQRRHGDAVNPLSRWLRNVPTSNPVDRRNAPFLQVLMLFFGLFVPINKAIFLYAVATGQVPSPGTLQLTADLVTDVLLVGSAWIALWLIRTDRFRQGVALFLAVASLCVGIAYASVGLARVGLDPIPLVLLSLAGLVMGRRALWLMLASLTVMLLACMALDMVRAGSPMPATVIGKMVSIGGVWLIITLVLDRTVAALRNSLEESEQRGLALERAYTQLEDETAERERTREQLIHSQKMDLAGRLASGLAHDFNNVLSIILGYAEQRDQLAAKGGGPALVAALEGVELAARRAAAVSRKLLNFSRLDISQPEIFDAGVALQELQPMLRQLLSHPIRLLLERTDAPLPVRMDKGNFELMVLSIAGNARDVLPEDGTFRLAASHDEATDSLTLTLSDNGPGIPESVRAHVFTPFFTTKPKGRGTGLGLSVVRDIVLDAGGAISIDCPSAGGTSLQITLPLASPALS